MPVFARLWRGLAAGGGRFTSRLKNGKIRNSQIKPNEGEDNVIRTSSHTYGIQPA